MSAVDPLLLVQDACLDESNAHDDALEQFRQWYQQAIDAKLPQPEAMTLATCTPDGKPSARMVLLRGFDERGFVFYTNYLSRKGRELEQNPHAALVLYWEPLARQVRIEGTVEVISAEESDKYFASRPRGSQLGAWASEQSQQLQSRTQLDERMRELESTYGQDLPIPRPPHWGGFHVVPEVIEFWQGRDNRLHDRLCYIRSDRGWLRKRLAP